MLHRLTLRILPHLTLAVTEAQVRRRKRWVMMVPGFVAFAAYRAAKYLLPLSDPLVLLAVSGCISMITAIWAYRIGRDRKLSSVCREDGVARLAWIAGWIGFTYGVQLSLLVLALLRILAQYDFMHHPDGPAMMAIIIACTSVARDAFEIGYVRRMQQDGKPVLTFPDGQAFRRYLQEQPWHALQWAVIGASGCSILAMAAAQWPTGTSELGQFVAVTLGAGTITLFAYLAGGQLPGGWLMQLSPAASSQLFRFWWWPGLAFAATYYFVLSGLITFVLRANPSRVGLQAIVACGVGGTLALYGYFLGVRRRDEDRIQQVVPPSLLRCPFVLGILSKQSSAASKTSVPLSSPFLGDSHQQGLR